MAEQNYIYKIFTDKLEKLIKELPLDTENSSITPSMNDININQQSMNLFLNAIESGKTYVHSLNIARITDKDVKNWYIQGKKGENGQEEEEKLWF